MVLPGCFTARQLKEPFGAELLPRFSKNILKTVYNNTLGMRKVNLFLLMSLIRITYALDDSQYGAIIFILSHYQFFIVMSQREPRLVGHS